MRDTVNGAHPSPQHNRIGESGARSISRALKVNSSLVSLQLGVCGTLSPSAPGSQEADENCKEQRHWQWWSTRGSPSASRNTRIVTLSLRVGSGAAAEWKPDQCLTFRQGNSIGLSGARALIHTLGQDSGLTSLDLAVRAQQTPSIKVEAHW